MGNAQQMLNVLPCADTLMMMGPNRETVSLSSCLTQRACQISEL